MKILFTGGGTLGSVSPLIAIAESLKEKDVHCEMLWIGTKTGPERAFVASYNIPFTPIPAGKLRRYIDFKNIVDIIKIGLGFLKSIYILLNFGPDIIIGAGSFVQVPVIYAAKTFVKKPRIIIHQQDIKKGLANSLCEKIANKITTSTKKSLSDFPKRKTVYTGNPYRNDVVNGNPKEAYKIFNLNKKMPVVLILGGGTGAVKLNRLVTNSAEALSSFCQIIHLTGKDKTLKQINTKYYKTYDFLNEKLTSAFAVADIIVTRAGFSTLTELAMLAKPLLIIPMPATHQEDNANYFKKHGAAIVMDQKNITPDLFAQKIKKILEDNQLKFSLSSHLNGLMPKDATAKFLKEMSKLLECKQIGVKNF